MDFSLKKSFKSLGSSKHISAEADHSSHEKLPILLDHHNEQHAMSAVDSSGRREVFVKIDEGGASSTTTEADPAKLGAGIWRESSIDFWKDDGSNVGSSGEFEFGRKKKTATKTEEEEEEEDPPAKLIGRFLHKQRAFGDSSLDMDLEMDELRPQDLPSLAESPRNSRTSREIKVPSVRRRRWSG